MDPQMAQAAAAIGVPTIAALIWLLRLEGRVKVQAALHAELKDDVKYIRERIDRALNGA